jgi:hypothetical protein
MFLEQLQGKKSLNLRSNATELIVDILQNMTDGKLVAVISTELEISSQEAANYLRYIVRSYYLTT